MSILTKIGALLALLIITGCALQPILDADSHEHTPHAGVMVPFNSEHSKVGFVELKLHDDKGDLELWLTKDITGTKPFDLSLDSKIKVFFPSINKREIELYIRNSKKNEDEEGNGNIRKNKTNYFIFPGKTGSDASFLVGKDFTTKATISFEVNNILYTTDLFDLYPHTH